MECACRRPQFIHLQHPCERASRSNRPRHGSSTSFGHGALLLPGAKDNNIESRRASLHFSELRYITSLILVHVRQLAPQVHCNEFMHDLTYKITKGLNSYHHAACPYLQYSQNPGDQVLCG